MIVARRPLVELNAALTGGIVETSFAVLRMSMAAFSEERAPSLPFGGWDLVVIVGTRGSSEKAVQRAGSEEESEP